MEQHVKWAINRLEELLPQIEATEKEVRSLLRQQSLLLLLWLGFLLASMRWHILIVMFVVVGGLVIWWMVRTDRAITRFVRLTQEAKTLTNVLEMFKAFASALTEEKADDIQL